MGHDRTLHLLALMAFAMLGLAGCVAVNGFVADRELTCEATPDDVCLRVSDFAVREGTAMFEEGRANAIVVRTVRVGPIDCADVDRILARTAMRCWQVDATFPDGYADIPITSSIAPGSFGAVVYERPDGTLGLWQ